MKLFLATLILTSVALAETPCNPIPLYRKRSKILITGMIDHIDTTDINEANVNYELDGQIATVCRNQAPGTLPLYRGFNPITKLHFTTISPNDRLFLGATKQKLTAYAYTLQQKPGYFQIYRITDEKSRTNYFSSALKNEGSANGKVFDRNLFWSMPLGAHNTTATTDTHSAGGHSTVVDPTVVDTAGQYSTVVDSTGQYSAGANVVEPTEIPCDETNAAPIVETNVGTYDGSTGSTNEYNSQEVAPVVEPPTASYDGGSNVIPDTTTPCEEEAPEISDPYDVAPVPEASTIPCSETTEAPIAIDTPYPTPTDTESSFPTDTHAPIFSSASSQTVSFAAALLAIVFSL